MSIRSWRARVCVVAGAVLAVVLPVVAGGRVDGYDAVTQYISELGADGAPDGALVSGAFVVIGLLLFAVPLLVPDEVGPDSLVGLGWTAVLAGLGLSYVVGGVARCDAGCPESGAVSFSQQVHSGVGIVGYATAIVGVGATWYGYRRAGADESHTALAAVVGAFAALFATLSAITDERGLHQRLLELVLLGWLVVTTWRLTEDERSRPGPRTSDASRP